MKLKLNDSLIMELGLYGKLLGRWAPSPDSMSWTCIWGLDKGLYLRVESADREFTVYSVTAVYLDDQLKEEFLEWAVNHWLSVDLTD